MLQICSRVLDPDLDHIRRFDEDLKFCSEPETRTDTGSVSRLDKTLCIYSKLCTYIYLFIFVVTK